MWLHGLILIATTVLLVRCTVDVELPNMEAAFQGRCGHGSPCEQLCYELHDGMYECDCTEGYELNRNGYSCQEINSTFLSGEQDNQQIEEDILYQRGASFSAKLDDSNTHSTSGSSSSSSSSSSNLSTNTNSSTTNDNEKTSVKTNKIIKISEHKLVISSDKQPLSSVVSRQNTINEITKYTKLGLKSDSSRISKIKSIDITTTTNTNTTQQPPLLQTSIDGYYSKEDTTGYDTSISENSSSSKSVIADSETEDVGNKLQSEDSIDAKMLIADKKKSVLNGYEQTNETGKGVNTIPEKRKTNKTDESAKATISSCSLDCGSDGLCDSVDNAPVCLCSYGKAGERCEEDVKITTPKFRNKSWLAFPALKGAYKHVQIHIEFRPEAFDGIILLTGERDDLTGDFIALLIYQGFIEFWFDCGSGMGKVKSEETVMLNQWNTITIFRHRWDAWLILNQGNRVQGRSKGLFSRITFREPVFLGGTGNITGLAKKLPTTNGMVGCVRKFIANDHEYSFDSTPFGDVTQGFDIQECSTDRCSHFPCQHGGKCLPSDQGAICLCPLGFGGDLCEMRLDLQVPSFNGSSYLRFAPLGDSTIIWFELKIILKPQHEDGLLMYSGHHEYGDYIALCLNMGFVEFTFDLGSGPATVRSEIQLTMGQWHTIKISRTARLAVLKIDQLPEVMTISPNGFWHLSLPHSLFLGGVHNMQTLPMRLKEMGSFVGCIQKVEINNHQMSIIAEALGGSNVDNCPHACVARPCGPLATCIPNLESYECQCNPYNTQCNQAEEISSDELLSKDHTNNNDLSSASTDGNHYSDGDNDSYYYDYDEDDVDETQKSGSNYETDKNLVDDKTIKISRDFVKQNFDKTTTMLALQQQQLNDDNKNNEMTPPPTSNVRGRFMIHDSKDKVIDKLVASDKSKMGTKKKIKQQKYDKDDETQHRIVSNDYDNIKLISNYDPRKTFVTIDGDVRAKGEKVIASQVLGETSVKAVHKQHKMRYRPEDDTVIDEIFIDGEDDVDRMGSGSVKFKMPNQRKYHGACFTGTDSYFHYNDVDTMKKIISYRIDLNLRFRTHSTNGLILWSGRHSAYEDDDFLSLGVENGYLHLRYNLGSGDVNIRYNSTKVSDGLWHRIRAMRNSQEGTLKVDGGKPIMKRSPGKLRQLNTDTGLYVGGMPNTQFYTRQRYINGISGCISEIVLASELRLNLDAKTLGTAHNVEPGAP